EVVLRREQVVNLLVLVVEAGRRVELESGFLVRRQLRPGLRCPLPVQAADEDEIGQWAIPGVRDLHEPTWNEPRRPIWQPRDLIPPSGCNADITGSAERFRSEKHGIGRLD